MIRPSVSLLRVRPCHLLVAVALACVSLPSTGSAQARERAIYVSALDKDGKPVESLAPADIVVREDGVAREVLRIGPATDPMQVALLVDNSAISSSHVTNLRDGLKAFLKTLGSGSEISLITYADRPTLVTNVSTSLAEVEKGIERIFPQPNSGAYLLDALDETARGFIKRESPRPVIVVIGFEGVEFSNSGYQSVLERVKESGAQMHALVLVDNEPDRTQEERDRSIVIARGTSETGGRRDNLLASMSLPGAAEALARELKGQFKVVYAQPDSLIPPRELTITSGRTDLEVRGVRVRPASTVPR